jgi:hypothetical protein
MTTMRTAETTMTVSTLLYPILPSSDPDPEPIEPPSYIDTKSTTGLSPSLELRPPTSTMRKTVVTTMTVSILLYLLLPSSQCLGF